MKHEIKFTTAVLAVVSLLTFGFNPLHQNKNGTPPDPLPSWNAGSSKKAIIDFVTKTTKKDSKDFIPVADRIACFDNDGTLWAEQPMYFQLAFAIDQVKAMAPQHPEWKTTQPFQALLEGDIKTALAGGEKAIVQIMMTTHSGMSTEAFEKTVKDWMATAIHPKTKKHFNLKCLYKS